MAGGATAASWAPRRARRSPETHSGLVEAGFVPIWARSCAVPAGLLLGVPGRPTQGAGAHRGDIYTRRYKTHMGGAPAAQVAPWAGEHLTVRLADCERGIA